MAASALDGEALDGVRDGVGVLDDLLDDVGDDVGLILPGHRLVGDDGDGLGDLGGDLRVVLDDGDDPLVEVDVLAASCLTSSATTANPRPCSRPWPPSMAALRASRLV